MERTKTKILSALISVLQIQGLNGETFWKPKSLYSLTVSHLSTRRRHFPATSVTVVCVWDGERRGPDSYWCHRSPEPKWWPWGWGEHGDGLPTQLTERPKRRSELTHLIVFALFFAPQKWCKSFFSLSGVCYSAALGKGTVSNRWGWRALGLCDEEGSGTSLCPQRGRAQPQIQTQPLLHRGSASPAAHTGPHTSGRHKTTQQFCLGMLSFTCYEGGTGVAKRASGHRRMWQSHWSCRGQQRLHQQESPKQSASLFWVCTRVHLMERPR